MTLAIIFHTHTHTHNPYHMFDYLQHAYLGTKKTLPLHSILKINILNSNGLDKIQQ